MTPEQFTELRTLLTEMLSPVRDAALYQLRQAGQPVPEPPTTRSIMAEQAARVEASKREPTPPGPGNPGPYGVFPVPFSGNDPLDARGWEVRGAGNVGTGFIGTRADATAEADRLNGDQNERRVALDRDNHTNE